MFGAPLVAALRAMHLVARGLQPAAHRGVRIGHADGVLLLPFAHPSSRSAAPSARILAPTRAATGSVALTPGFYE
jgi:hypothetical protein